MPSKSFCVELKPNYRFKQGRIRHEGQVSTCFEDIKRQEVYLWLFQPIARNKSVLCLKHGLRVDPAVINAEAEEPLGNLDFSEISKA
jgi:hypothetical protein